MILAVCDDNNLEKQVLLNALDKISFINSITCFDSADKLLESFRENKYDVVILDVQMPKMDGLCASKLIREFNEDTHIIFLSGFDTYSMEAFSVYPTDYLLKPVNPKRLEKTLKRINEKILNKNDKIVEVKTQNTIYRIRQSDIVFLEKVQNRCIVYTKQFTFDVLTPLKYFEDVLDKNIFVRTHAGYIVNKNEISRIEVNGNLSYTLHFYNTEETALVSRGKKNRLLNSKGNGR